MAPDHREAEPRARLKFHRLSRWNNQYELWPDSTRSILKPCKIKANSKKMMTKWDTTNNPINERQTWNWSCRSCCITLILLIQLMNSFNSVGANSSSVISSIGRVEGAGFHLHHEIIHFDGHPLAKCLFFLPYFFFFLFLIDISLFMMEPARVIKLQGFALLDQMNSN